MIAINGPTQGKNYITPAETKMVIDHLRFLDGTIFEVTYYRTKNGWAFHSWKNLFRGF